MALKKIVIVGATSSIALHCARLWLNKEPIDCILIGRDRMKLELIAADLQVRSPKSTISVITTDFLNPEAISQTVQNISQAGAIDSVLIAQGFLPDQKLCQQDLTLCEKTLSINAISPVLFAEAFVNDMEIRNEGTIIILGSVAGDRGRKENYIYGCAKGLLDQYVKGLQHRLAKTQVNIVLVKPGPTLTPMTAHLNARRYKLASVEQVARIIVHSIDRGKKVIYAPKRWRAIMLIVRIIPQFIFHNLLT